MAKSPEGKSKGKPVAVVIGATSKWQSDGRNTKLIHGKAVDDSKLPVGVRWGVGGSAIDTHDHLRTRLGSEGERTLEGIAPCASVVAGAHNMLGRVLECAHDGVLQRMERVADGSQQAVRRAGDVDEATVFEHQPFQDVDAGDQQLTAAGTGEQLVGNGAAVAHPPGRGRFVGQNGTFGVGHDAPAP